MSERAPAGTPGQQARAELCAMAVLARGRPGPGLVPPLTPQEAAELDAAFLGDMADNLAAAGREAPVAALLVPGPAGPPDGLPAEVGLIEVHGSGAGGSEGGPLLAAASRLLDLGYGSACLLAPDGPTLPAARLVAAAEALGRPGERLVLGPRIEGGYYLVGVTGAGRSLLEGAGWDDGALAGRARALGLEVVELPAWHGGSDAGALRHLVEETRRPGVPQPDGSVPHAAPRTAAWLKARLAGSDLGNRLGIGGGVEADMSEGSLS